MSNHPFIFLQEVQNIQNFSLVFSSSVKMIDLDRLTENFEVLYLNVGIFRCC